MTRLEEVFQLVQKLSKAEKRYFTIRCQKQASTKKNKDQIDHLILFQVLANLENCDLNLLQKKLKGQKVLERLPIALNQLFYSLLKSLRDFHYNNSEQAKMRDYIFQAKLLRDRTLYKQGQNMLDKAKKIALKFDDPLDLLEINRLERSLMYHNSKNSEQEVHSIIEKKNKLLDRLTVEFEWFDRSNQMSQNLKKEIRKNQNEEDNTALLIPFEYADDNTDDQLTLIAQYRRLQAYALFYMQQNMLSKSNNYFLELINWWNEYPFLKKAHFSTYRSDVMNYLANCFKLGQLDLIQKMVAQLKMNQEKAADEDFFLFKLDTKYNFLVLINTGQFDKALEKIPTMQAGLKKFSLQKSTTATIIYNISACYFIMENFHSMIPNLQSFRKIKEERADLQRLAKLLLIIAYYETEQIDALFNHIRTSKNYFKKDNSIPRNGFIYTIFNYLRSFSEAVEYDKKKILRDMRTYLSDLKNNPKIKSISGLDEFLIWTISRIERKPMQQIAIDFVA